MDTKELILPDNWEVKEVVGNKIVIREKEERGLPKTWRKCCEVLKEGEYIDSASEIKQVAFNNISESDKNFLPDGLGKPMLALCQLLICRNAWWKQMGWKPDWTNAEEKYCIECQEGKVSYNEYYSTNKILAFPTPKIRNQFCESFRDLIEEAKELL